MTTDDELRAAIIDVLGMSASTPTEIARQLVDGGVVPGPAASAERRARGLFQRDTSFAEVSGGVMYVPAVMDGTVWTVWVDPDDAAEDFVRMLPQLSPLIWWMIEEDLDLLDASGAVVGELTVDDVWLDDRDLDVVRGPHGWLDDLAGGWASVAVGRQRAALDGERGASGAERPAGGCGACRVRAIRIHRAARDVRRRTPGVEARA